ncbi:MAG: hypothetical protein VKI83_12135 [Synechococcaceae cyanobacterium]|nr:hypothetical protein [Synechococcaceae cyanobacterium]
MTLVELLVGSVLLAFVIAGSARMFILNSVQSESMRLRYELQARIDRDMAVVRRMNDRYSCASGSCTSQRSTDPSKSQYLPSFSMPMTISETTIVNNFEARCYYKSGVDLVSPLVAELNNTTLLPVPSGLRRVAEAGSATQQGVHRYSITYSRLDTGEVLRKVILVPTTAGWCP